MGKRDVAKRRDPFVQIVKHEITDIPTCQNIDTYKDRSMESRHTHKHVYTHALVCLDTYTLNMHQETGTQICILKCSQM